MSKKPKISLAPLPLFDSLRHFFDEDTVDINHYDCFRVDDYALMRNFLLQYKSSKDTFNVYRRELERLAHWSWRIVDKSILELNRDDMIGYIEFANAPPKQWIGLKNVARFIKNHSGERVPNPEWSMFVVNRTKYRQTHDEDLPIKGLYSLSDKALQSLFSSLSSFYNNLIRDNITQVNPIIQIRQKSNFFRKQQTKRQVRRLTGYQWNHVLQTARNMASENPAKHARTLFIMSCLYLMYLRISELASSSRWQPQMGHFYRDSDERWWFKTVSKGNKERDISVSQAMLTALKDYRAHLKLLPSLPSPGEMTPLICKLKGKGSIRSTREIRRIVQSCFDTSILSLQEKGETDDAAGLAAATVHWLRHTGISDDLNKVGRPTSHVRDDAGHFSSATTDLYNDSEIAARHDSAQDKDAIFEDS